MERLSENKLILVTRRTRVDELVTRFNTLQQAQFYVEHSGADFADYLAEHEQYHRCVSETRLVLEQIGRVHVIDRAFLPNFLFGPNDTVVALGQDGLVANTLKYLSAQPLIGVNPDPRRWDGVLLPFKVGDLPKVVPEVFAGRRPMRRVTMAEANLNNGQRLLAVNDLFIGPRSHTSARYTLRSGSEEERQSSSGLIVSTGLGSTGWFRSLLVGATAISGALSGHDLKALAHKPMRWDADHLYFTVREPFPSKSSAASLVFGKVTASQPLTLISLMPEGGVIFSDGIESDFLQFNSGIEATISLAKEQGTLVI